MPVSERRAILLAGDLAISALALLSATYPRGWWDLPGNAPVWWWFASLLALDLVISLASDAHDLGKAANPYHGSYVSIRAWLVTTLVYLALPYLSAPLVQSRSSILVFFLVGLVLRVGWRSAYALLLRQPRFMTCFVVVGAGRAASTITQAIHTHLGPEYIVLGCIDDDPHEGYETADGLPILGGSETLDMLIQRGLVSTLILANTGVMPASLYSSVIRAYEAGVRVVPMPVFYEAVTGRVPVEHVGDYWYVALPKMEQDWLYHIAKRLMDIAGGLAGIVLTVLLFAPVALAIKLSGPGPVLYTQTRLGLNGRSFRLRKFRTMVADAEADGVPRWAQTRDARVTRVGGFLRASRLDELPQFWNVLTGEMSLVGPRPERPEFIASLQHQVPFYRVRLLARPGITGWAQVKQTYAGSVDETLVKLQYDLYYISHQSLYLDLLILLKTVGVVLRLRGR